MNLGTVAGNARADSTGFVDGMEMLMHQEVLVPPFGGRQIHILGVPFSDTRTGSNKFRRVLGHERQALNGRRCR